MGARGAVARHLGVAIKSVVALLLVAYPFLVYYGLTHFRLSQVALFICFILLTRLAFFKRDQLLKSYLLVIVMGGILLNLSGALLGSEILIKLYPVLVSLVMLGVFAHSLTTDESVVERIARLREGQLTAAAVRYTRKVTWIWCGFFVINASLSSFTVFVLSSKWWALYNGLLSYILIGALLVGERLVRIRVKAREERCS